MGVFGTVWVNTTNGTLLEHQGTVQDEVMNYLLGVCLVLLLPVGVFCNVLVFRYNTTSSSSDTLSALFYRFLSALDLMICCFRTPHQIYALLRPGHEDRFYVSTPPSLLILRLVSLLTLNNTMLGMEVVSLLGLVRFMAVGFPLYYRQHTAHIKLVFTVLLVSLTLIILGLNLDYFGFFGADVYWISVIQWIVCSGHSATISILNIYIPCTGLILAVVTSTATVICLVRCDDKSAHSRGSVTVILMNLGLIFYLVLLFIATFHLPFGYDTMLKYLESGRYEMYYIYYFIGTYMPLLLAVYNPLVVATRCHGTRSLAAKWLVGLHGTSQFQFAGLRMLTCLRKTQRETVRIAHNIPVAWWVGALEPHHRSSSEICRSTPMRGRSLNVNININMNVNINMDVDVDVDVDFLTYE